MSEPFLGQITIFAGNFAPRGYGLCDGQLLAISQNSALFSLLGTIYGGDGRTAFALPDLRGRLPLHEGSGPGLTSRTQGARVGTETHAIGVGELAPHNHAGLVSANAGDGPNPVGKVPAVAPVNAYSSAAPDTDLGAAEASSLTGGGQAHNNIMPFLCVNFIIALQGTFPSRN